MAVHNRALRVGIVCPYSFETPGGVQNHIKEFAQEMRKRGHQVLVYAPGRRTKDMPLWVQTNDSSFAIPYNGSWAHLSYFLTARRNTNRWVKQGKFDIVHLHEPEAPSLSHKPLLIHRGAPPMVATFHASIEPYPKALHFFERYLREYFRPLRQAIFVSPAAQHTADYYLPHEGLERHIIPNGIHCDQFTSAQPHESWQGSSEAPTIGFLGRMGEERKGFKIYAQAAQEIIQQVPSARFLVAGDGQREGEEILAQIDTTGQLASHFEFLGRISDEEKAQFYRSLTLYVAPQTGGESFGIVLAEAMAATCPIVASQLPAFCDVTHNGQCAQLFETGNAHACAQAILQVLNSTDLQHSLATKGMKRAQDFDWSTVVDQVLAVYRRTLS